MKKAFDANVSRAKPRVRLGGLLEETAWSQGGAESRDQELQTAAVEAIAAQVMGEPLSADLSQAVRARAAGRTSRPSAAESLQQALHIPDPRASAGAVATSRETWSERPAEVDPLVDSASAPDVETVRSPEPIIPPSQARTSLSEESPAARAVPHVLSAVTSSPAERRERLKQRLRSVRENPRPEPLPETVAEAGVFAVERIASLQSELTKARAMNLALAQDLEATRRQAERATEEARVRMDEARRLSGEMESRALLLSELERELKSLESERDEVILTVQDARQALQTMASEKGVLEDRLKHKEQEVTDSLAEEERLATELEAAQETVASLRRSSEVLKTECATLARQVADLTFERAELLEARKALEAVHRALSKAAVG